MENEYSTMDSEKAMESIDTRVNTRNSERVVPAEVEVLIYPFSDTDIRTKCDGAWTAAHFNHWIERPPTFELLITAYPSLANARTPDGLTLLMTAADRGDIVAVTHLLKFLTADDVKVATMDGRNSLDYAVSSLAPDAAEIAILLLEKCDDYFFVIPPSAIIERNILEQSVRKKNVKLIKLLLEVVHQPVVAWLTDQKCILGNILKYCIQQNWSTGVQTTIDDHLLRCLERPADYQTTSVVCNTLERGLISGDREFEFLIRCEDERKLYSPWAFCIRKGLTEIMHILLDRGLTLQHLCIIYVGDDILPHHRLKYVYHPMTLVFSNTIERNMDFVKTLISIQSAEEFDRILLTTCKDMRWTFQNFKEFRHPLTALISSYSKYARTDQNGLSYSSAIKFLYKSGFTFNFAHIPVLDPGNRTVEWTKTLTYLLLYLKEGFDPGCRFLLSHLLECDRKLRQLQVTSATIFALIQAEQVAYFADEFSHDIWLQLTSKSPMAIDFIINDLKLEARSDKLLYETKLSFYEDGKEKRYLCPCSLKCDPGQIIKLLLKGVPLLMHPLTLHPYSIIPAALFFCEANIQKPHFKSDDESSKSTEEAVMAIDDVRLCYELSTPAHHSLKYLCRNTIRGVIGASRLVREPVPRRFISTRLDQFTAEERELSAIDKLPIPIKLKEYVMCLDEFNDYCLHRESRKSPWHKYPSDKYMM